MITFLAIVGGFFSVLVIGAFFYSLSYSLWESYMDATVWRERFDKLAAVNVMLTHRAVDAEALVEIWKAQCSRMIAPPTSIQPVLPPNCS